MILDSLDAMTVYWNSSGFLRLLNICDQLIRALVQKKRGIGDRLIAIASITGSGVSPTIGSA